MKRLCAGLALGLVTLAVLATPAAAHAELLETVPASGAVLDAPPRSLELRFNEPVEGGLGAVRLFDESGDRLETGPVQRRGQALHVALPELENDGYVVTWRVISADAHPVRGAFTFRIGPVPPNDQTGDLAKRLLAASGTSRVSGALHAAARTAAFAGLVVLIGAAVFGVAIWPAGHRSRGVRRLVASGWLAATVATAVGIPLQAAYAGGLDLGDAFTTGAIGDVLATRFGTVWAMRLGLLAAAAMLLAVAARRGPTKPLLVAGAAVGVALLATPGLSGHASAGDLVGIAIAADVVHLAAVSVWLGGLAVLAVVVLRSSTETTAPTVARFSRVALWTVVTIVVSGTFHTWRQVGSVDALTDTSFGHLLLVKLALFCGLIGLAAFGRWVVNTRVRAPVPVMSVGAMAAPADSETLRRLRRSVGMEVVLGAVVLAVTALLVNVPPARDALAQPRSISMAGEQLLVDVTVDPARRGVTDVHLYTLSQTGEVLQVEDVAMALRQPTRDVGPLQVPLTVAGPGHYAAYGYDLPLSGEWQLEVVVRISEFEEERLTGTFSAR